jgi:hypothetical protein
MLHVALAPYGELTAAYVQIMAKRHSFESGNHLEQCRHTDKLEQ